MTLSLYQVPVVRFADGREASVNDVISMGHAGLVNLSGAVLLPGASQDAIDALSRMPMTIGDDSMDVMIGAYNIAKNLDLLAYPDPKVFTDAPAIVVGSGPSLDGMIKTLKDTYGKYLIVSSASAVRKLLDNSIIPHVVAPKERIKYPDWCFYGVPDHVKYGGLLVVPGIHHRFTQAWCVGDCNPLSGWAGAYRHCATGPTSGTHAVSLALDLTSGPVYLVGIDNCGGHYTGYQGTEIGVDSAVKCYDGQLRESQWVYNISRENIGRNSRGRVVQTSPQAAVIDGVFCEPLCPGRHVEMPTILPVHQDRVDVFKSNLRRLPEDWDNFWGLTQAAEKIEDANLLKLESANRVLFRSILIPTLAQLSMERRQGMSDGDVMAWFREATLNIMDKLSPTINAMATIGRIGQPV